MFGEEYTLVAVADYILSHTPGSVVSNLSSTRALRDVAASHGQTYTASAVGEVNVVNAMTETDAIIGGEGNGGVIYPTLHAGRDALVGIALFLVAPRPPRGIGFGHEIGVSSLRNGQSQNRPRSAWDVDSLLATFAKEVGPFAPSTIDGVKLDLPEGWVHLRKSNTEPIVRVYAEAASKEAAMALVNTYRDRLLSCA